MAADPHAEENEEFTTPHLPERYHQVVKAKKQRRLHKHLLTAGGIVFLVVLIYILLGSALSGILSGPSSEPSVQPAPLPMTAALPGSASATPCITNQSVTFERGSGIAGQLPPGAVSLDAAVAALHQGYPDPVFIITRADRETRNGRTLYVFEVRSRDGGSTTPVIVTFIDAMTGKPYSPGEETARVPRDEARAKALSLFPSLHPDAVRLEFAGSAAEGRTWDYVLFQKGLPAASGTLDADTGEERSLLRFIPPEGRPASPAIDAARADTLAERYIINHNGGQLPLNKSRVRYMPFTASTGSVAGQYVLTYERTFLDYVTDIDGFVVTVDAATGDVIGYTARWTTPDHAFSASSQPEVIKREATFAVLEKAKEVYPDDVAGLRIISAELRWKNAVPYGTVPRPGTIPLGWKVVFDDEVIRGNTSATPGIAWVDIQSGDFISFDYRH